MKKKRHIAFYILFPIVYLLLSGILIFYLDLANGPFFLFIIELVALLALLVLSILLLNKRFLHRAFVWLGFFAITFGVLAFAKPTTESKSAAYYANPVKVENTLALRNGLVQGIYNKDKDVEIYAGIPYAKAPIGELRWKEPQPVEDWEGVRDCSHFAPKSMQPASNSVTNTLVDMYAEKSWHPDFTMHPNQNRSEDSLYLNIWRPKNAENLPVLIFIHGGSLTSGSSGFEDYNGESMAKNGVIMVTITYRLGVFGYFALPELKEESPNGTTGNYGLLDQIAAVNFVHDNATYFGGDPDNITIAGESAGSSSVSALCTTPLLRGTHTFKRAIGESSSIAMKSAPHTFRSLDEAYKAGEKIKAEWNCTTLEELRAIPAEKLVETKVSNSAMTLDGYALDELPYRVYEEGKNNEEELLNGYNVWEADAFVVPNFLFSPTSFDNAKERLAMYFGESHGKEIFDLYEDRLKKDAFSYFNEIISVYWFMHPHHCWSKLALESGVRVFRYQFTKENGYYATNHSGEMVYCYGNISRTNRSFAYDQSDYELSNTMLSYWANFAKTGDPNSSSLPTWEEYEEGKERVLELGEEVRMKEENYLDLYALFDKYAEEAE